MPLHTFENPLNEKSRIYLRLEYLFAQLFDNCEQQQSWQHLAFFKALFELQELLERGDPRMELLKDLEKQSQKLALWSQYPGIDRELVDQLETRLHSAQQNLPRMARAIQHLKEDKLLGAIRPRFNIPGGCCSFDVPALHLWLGQESELQQPQIGQWIDGLRPLSEAIELLLWFWRESAQYQEQTARNGFFQDATESAQMIRILFDSDHGHYPSVSGNKSRFTIRFLPLGNEKTTDIPFELARC